MGYPNWIERISDVLAEDIRTRTNNPTLNAVLGVVDGAGKSIGGNLGDFQANTNLQTLKAVIGGGFETDNVDMYARLYTGAVAYINDVACPAAPGAGSMLQVLVEDIKERTLGETTLEGLLGVPDTAAYSLWANLGDFQGSTLGSLYAVVGNPGTNSLTAVIGQLLDAALGMNAASTGAETEITLLRSILERIGETPADPDDSMLTILGQRDDAALATNVAPGGADTEITLLRSILDRIGQTPLAADDAIHTILGQRDAVALGKNVNDDGTQSEIALLRSLIDRVGNVGASDIDGLLDTLTADVTGATGIFHEQEDTPVNITAIAASEVTVLDLSVASTRYRVLSLRLKAADPSTETMTVRLYELINDVLTVVDTFAIDAANWGTYHSLMDMFGIPHLAGDNLKVTVQMSGGAGVAVTGQYSHSKTNV